MSEPWYPVGLFIGIPDSSLRPASDPERTNTPDHWLPRPSPNGVVEIAVMKWKVLQIGEEWPGKKDGTELKFACITSAENSYDEEAVGVLTRYLSYDHPVAQSINKSANQAASGYDPIILDSPERRGYTAGYNSAGAIVIAEYAVD